MNVTKWSNIHEVELSRYVAKLTEEVGEVAKAFGDYIEAPLAAPSEVEALRAMVDEVGHVVFIASQLRRKCEALLP